MQAETQCNSKPLILGHSTFMSTLSQQKLDRFDNQIKSFFGKKNWQISRFQQKVPKWAQTFSYVKASTSETLFINKVCLPAGQQITVLSLFKQIVKTHFSCMKQISICQTVQTIESLPFLYCEFLESCYLFHNKITCLNGLKKTRWSNMRILSVKYNPIYRLDFSRVKMNSQLKEFTTTSKFGAQFFFCDIGIITKFECKTVEPLSFLNISSKHFIHEKAKAQCIKRKFSQIVASNEARQLELGQGIKNEFWINKQTEQ